MGGERRFVCLCGDDKSVETLEGSQALPACPSDKGSTTTKGLQWLEVRAVRRVL